ncbi:MAG: prolipoprotein diacylglyceryl transferase [Clostridia bacterium]|nr:prolipoprotein diacylglyceryl transferase [Clostridia bacterium]
MYPYDILPGIDLYLIFLCVAVISAIVVYRIMADKLKIEAKLQNLCIFTAVAAIIGGYYSAVFFQALYNIKKYGKFIINSNTGATFYGGLIGGAVIFLLIYFIAGKYMFPQKEHISRFFDIADIAACSISIAHSFGRIGCLMAGCCHGKTTTAWFGINMLVDGRMQKVIPTQAFEAVFLILLFVYLISRIKDKETYCLQIYMCVYGVWRFMIEYLRDDYRGSTFIEVLTPSQLTAVLMVIAGIALIFLQRKLKNKVAAVADGESASAEEEYEYEEEYDYSYGQSSNENESEADGEEKTKDDSEN